MVALPTFEEADALMQEIIAFLVDCGGVYKEETALLQETILMAIAMNQQIIKRNEQGKINHWLCYWKIQPKDVSDVCNNIRPIDLQNGSIMYVAEHGNTAGRHGITEIIKDLRAIMQRDGMHGVFWNSKGRGMKLFLRKGA